LKNGQHEEVKQVANKDEFEKMVAPPFPELFAAGSVINAYSPQDKKQTESLVEAIKAFNVKIVLVVD